MANTVEARKAYQEKTQNLSSEQKNKLSNLTMKFSGLDFLALFDRVEVGPVVTTYFFTPAPTSSLSKILSKAEDIALSVGAESILITRVRGQIAVAVPNNERTIIQFDKCLYNAISAPNGYQLPILMGQDTMGKGILIDLYAQPHILIAGSTGSGKSVFLSQIIASLAIQKSPQTLHFNLVDTKRLDLTLFTGLPHLRYMITDISGLRNVLLKLLAIVRGRTVAMEGRYRNIAEYNKANPNTAYLYEILVIDELADVISQDKELARHEDRDTKQTRISVLLSQLAQISRAAGVHIIAATQRPSVQIINGDIKANFPARICFKLPSAVDSRVVLDEVGAENLLGKGDYLYKTAEDSTVKRGHSAFVQLAVIDTIVKQCESIRKSLHLE